MIAVRASDPLGLSAEATATITITNLPPLVDAPIVAADTTTEGQAVTPTATFSDPAGQLDAPFTCSVDYGDGSPITAGTVNGTTCTAPAHTFTGYGSYKVTFTITDKDGGSGSATTRHYVLFNWSGFFAPVANAPAWNAVKAGSAIPLKFSLGGYRGLEVFAPGYPRSVWMPCSGNGEETDLQIADTAGASSLTYDTSRQQYVWVWKSEKAWAGTCRELRIKLVDGSVHYAQFKFR